MNESLLAGTISSVSRPSPDRPLSRRHRIGGTVAGAMVAAAVCGISPVHAALVTDNFEAFTGPSGTTVNGYANWGSVNNAVVNSDATAYDGTHYLRLIDTSTTAGVSTAKKTFSTTAVAADGASISFALRDDADGTGFNNNQVVFYGATGTPALQLGMKASSASAAVFSYSSYTAGTATVTTSLAPAVVADDWYLLNIAYAVNPTTLAGTYSLSITNESTPTPTVVYTSTTPLSGQTAFPSVAAENLSSLLVETSVSGIGSADQDAFSIASAVPEPASLAGLATFGSGLLLRRHRRRL